MEHEHVSSFMPHGHCYLWQPALVWSHVISDMLIGLSYLSISVTLYVLIRRTKLPFSAVFLAFGVFIAACGMTHFLEVWNLWYADYWVAAFVKMITAGASLVTAVWLFPLMPKVLAFASAVRVSEERGQQLRVAYQQMEERVRDRTADLERASKLKDEFLATISHELRTPLSVILGFSEMLVTDPLTEAQKQEALTTIRRNAQAQAQLVNDLLDVSMIISGKMRLAPDNLQLDQIIESSIESVRLAAQAKGIQLSFEKPTGRWWMRGDPVRMQQVIWNLLSNAIKFTAKGGHVVVRLDRVDSRYQVTVQDNGIGIDPDFLPLVFERFRQEDSGSARRYGGLGLGLGIVRNLVELHGGTVSAESEGKGKGALFKVSLPISAVEETSAEAVVTLPKDLAGRKILIVDDEPDVRTLLVTTLQSAGFVVETAESADEAEAKIPRFLPDLLLCDIGMPIRDGYEFIRSIRHRELREGGFLPAIALTAYAHAEDRRRALSAGFQAHLTKPVQRAQLLSQISQQMSSD